ncbi:MAG: FAD/NAD(P)-binding protein [Microbacteriaceae bacterium]|nr:FAD/NAD(P)-binding protein [Microbacteriaceae bacterium]
MTPAAPGGPYDAVIVGGGPRAIATALRLRARLADSAAPVRLAIVDAVEVGTGATWRADQPAAYLNNTRAATSTIHPDGSTRMTGPLEPGPTLTEWAAAIVRRGGHHRHEWVLAEARRLRPEDFPSRRLQGAYFRDQFDAAVADGRILVDEIVGVAVDLHRVAASGAAPARTEVELADGRRLAAPTAVLAQGMVQERAVDEVAELERAATEHGLRYVPPGMPAERDTARLPAGEPVLVRGLGANFFDLVGEWLDEWGGRFEPVEGDRRLRLRYRPSGREPRIVAGSGRGVPYCAKPDVEPTAPYAPRYATREWFAGFAGRSGVRFDDEIRPVVDRELAHAWCAALAERAPHALADDWRDALDAASTPAAVEEVLATRILDDRWSWRVGRIRRPTDGAPVDAEEWERRVARWIDHELGAMREPVTHPRAAVSRAMGLLRPQVRALGNARVLDGESHVGELDGAFSGDGLFLASGPPADRARRLLALVEAGVVELIGPELDVSVDAAAGRFVGRSPITGREVAARVLVEARMSRGRVPDTADPLLRALLADGRARIHRIDGVATTSIEATGAELDESVPGGHHLVAADGAVDESVVVLGIPALSTQPGSANGANPGIPSPLLAGADIAAKAILARR